MNRLGRYVFKSVFGYVLITLLVLTSVFLFFDMIAELRDVGKEGYTLQNALVYVALTLPSRLYQLLPVAVLIGSIFALSGMADTSQITVMRTAGVSILRLSGWMLVCGIAYALLTFLIGEFLAPIGSEAAKRYQVEAKQSVLLGKFRSGVWVKDGSNIMNVSVMNPDLSLEGVRIYALADGAKLSHIFDAQRASYGRDQRWHLSNVQRTDFHNDKVILTRLPNYIWQSEVNPDMLAVLMIKPQEMSVDALRSYIGHLETNKQSTLRYELAFWAKLFYPLACISMMLIALPFALAQRRAGNVGVKIFLGILLGVTFNFASQLVSYVGELYALPPILAAGLPSLVLMSLAIFFLWRQERGG
ncbi:MULTISPECIES: LPS export ABC transporter permease LptG [Deefgea]|uniref:LPS export ABC transporter permease LptG n=1 Tax=Deefgea chitinilytica TaxID=570276 RepID=A0ABS2CF24_9NEIS|nr:MULTISPECIES: LPS export ABC transporter permease LptG [Deefgea]MBM5572764.1 LPS export ABC transporter permease LptG [Deefgea chitinilytica]MBM9890000.1 LPS export ABC transporter permease LptG [Deefgea sp. CFH1-16]